MSDTLEAIRTLVAGERLGSVATIVAGDGLGAKAVIESGVGVIAGALPDHLLVDVLADAEALMAREQSLTLSYDHTDVFVETIAPQPHLLIFGAGHIAQPLCRIAKELGFRVTVADARATWATPERFPEADRLVVAWPDVVLEQVVLDHRTFVVLLSHDARFEDPVFPLVRKAPIRYIGAIGSRRTARSRAERLVAAGWSDGEVEAIHAPIGLDIGAVQPAEIAVAIVAEMIQARYEAGSGHDLRGVASRAQPLADRAKTI